MSQANAERPRIVVSHWVHDVVLNELGCHGEVVANPSRDSWPDEVLLQKTRSARALVAFMPDRIDDSFLAACPDLEIVAAALKGYDNIDVEAATRRGIWVSAVDDLLTAPTAELALTLLLALIRKVLPGDRLLRGSNFSGWRPVLYGASLSGSRVGILGFGKVGRAIAQRLQGFDATVRYTDPVAGDPQDDRRLGVERLPFDKLLATSEHLVLALPLLPSTYHLIGPEALACLPRGACVVNVGRGSVVDEEAVAAALEQGRLGGYAADVFALEDLSLEDRPRHIPASLLARREQTVLTPHLGSAVDSVRLAIARAAAQAVADVLGGRPPRGNLNQVARARATRPSPT